MKFSQSKPSQQADKSKDSQKKDKELKLSQKVNIIFVVFSIAVGALNFGYALSLGNSLFNAASGIPVIVSMLFSAFFLSVQNNFPKVRNILHVFCLFAIAVVVLLEFTTIPFGIGFAIIGLYLSYKYNFLKKYPILKIAVFSLTIFALILVSSISDFGLGRGILVVSFGLFFYSIIYTGEWEAIKMYQKHKKKIDEAMEEIHGKKINLKDIGFTPREIEIGRLLVETKVADKELAYELGISSNTMRNHLKSMRTKTNTESKQQLIDSVRWYYHAVETIEKLEKEREER